MAYHEQLGVVLKPLTLGHVDLMEKNACGFIDGGKVGWEDLLLGLCICSQTHDEFLEFCNNENAPTFVRDVWSRRIVEIVNNDSEFNLPHECRKFAAYMKDGIKDPKYVMETDAGKDVWMGAEAIRQSPYKALRRVLITKMNYRPDMIKDVIVADANRDFWSILEAEGHITVYEW